MSTRAPTFGAVPMAETEKAPVPPKTDWPLICDVATFRAGVPEALIQWRKARGEARPDPNEPWD